MSKIREWLNSMGNGILQNLGASVLATLILALSGVAYSYSVNHPQAVPLAILILVSTVNIFVSTYIVMQQRKISRDIQKLAIPKEEIRQTNDKDKPRDDIRDQLRYDLQVTDKQFDGDSKPQKLLIQFTNRGQNIINVKKIRHTSGGDLTLALHSSYKKSIEGGYEIRFDHAKSIILPDQTFLLEIELAHQWERQQIELKKGAWGALWLEVEYMGTTKEHFASI